MSFELLGSLYTHKFKKSRIRPVKSVVPQLLTISTRCVKVFARHVNCDAHNPSISWVAVTIQSIISWWPTTQVYGFYKPELHDPLARVVGNLSAPVDTRSATKSFNLDLKNSLFWTFPNIKKLLVLVEPLSLPWGAMSNSLLPSYTQSVALVKEG